LEGDPQERQRQRSTESFEGVQTMVKLNRLRLAVFRGVPGELQLDFTSPLTIIYAPNGTGKSSVIDAAEWLLTGEVKREGDFSNKNDASELRCKFAPSASRMEVEGWFQQVEEAFRLVRVPEACFLYREGDDAPHRTTNREVMNLFAPQGFGKVKGSRAALKLDRDWIRSVRFLTMSTLAQLIDTDTQNQTARETAIGGFLGVGELFARADKFENYARHLNDGIGGEEGLAAAKKELARRKVELTRLRKTLQMKDAGDNSMELDELKQSDLAQALLALDEKERTRMHDVSPEKPLTELKVMLKAKKQHQLELELAIRKLLERLPEIEGIESSIIRARRIKKDGFIRLRCLIKEIEDIIMKETLIDILVSDKSRHKDLPRKKSLYTEKIREIMILLKKCEGDDESSKYSNFDHFIEASHSWQKVTELRSALYSLDHKRQEHSLVEIIRTIEEKVRKIEMKRDQALEAARLFRGKANHYCAEQLDRLFVVAFPMFSGAQANEVFDSLHRGPLQNPLYWVAKSSSYEFTLLPHLSMGQRQDLALAIFLARARGVKGTFLLDEPVIHLDDLNRVALMDTFRMLVMESELLCNFVMTTAKRDFVRHMAEKFTNVPNFHGIPPLRIYELDGSPRVGVRVAKEWCSGVR
jgi:hypothetical protein